MGGLGFQSLIGIREVRRRSKQLTPLSSDVFVSIPDRDFRYYFHVISPRQISVYRIVRHQVLTYLTG